MRVLTVCLLVFVVRFEHEIPTITKFFCCSMSVSLTIRCNCFVGGENWKEHVVADERLVTGQNPASAHGVAVQMKHQLSELQAKAK